MWWRTAPIVVAALEEARAFTFLSVGDWGDVESKEYVSDIMDTYARNMDAKFVLAIGDNMYDTGVSSVDDPQFKTKFEDTFTADSLQVPWYVVGGNHDYYGQIAAEIQYTNKSDRWNFPSFYYKRYVEHDGVSLTIVGIDTWRLNGGDTYVAYHPKNERGYIRDHVRLEHERAAGTITEGTYASISRNFPKKHEVDFFVPDGVADQEQLDIIEGWLQRTNSTWTIVMGHFPCYSATVEEHGDTPSLIENLVPLLTKYKVDVYFSGHDHVLQHIQKGGVSYLGSGAGARKHTGMDTSYDGLVAYVQGKYGFMTHDLSADSFKTTFVVNNDGIAAEPYTFTMTK